MASRCGLHVVNMLLGHRVYNHEGFAALVRGMELPTGVARSWLMNPSGDYSQDLLERALEESLHPGRRERSCELLSLGDAEVFQRVRDGRLTSLVIQYDADPVKQESAHWMLFRKDDQGNWWNMDSRLFRGPIMMRSLVALQKIGYFKTHKYTNFLDASHIATNPAAPSTPTPTTAPNLSTSSDKPAPTSSNPQPPIPHAGSSASIAPTATPPSPAHAPTTTGAVAQAPMSNTRSPLTTTSTPSPSRQPCSSA